MKELSEVVVEANAQAGMYECQNKKLEQKVEEL